MRNFKLVVLAGLLLLVLGWLWALSANRVYATVEAWGLFDLTSTVWDSKNNNVRNVILTPSDGAQTMGLYLQTTEKTPREVRYGIVARGDFATCAEDKKCLVMEWMFKNHSEPGMFTFYIDRGANVTQPIPDLTIDLSDEVTGTNRTLEALQHIGTADERKLFMPLVVLARGVQLWDHWQEYGGLPPCNEGARGRLAFLRGTGDQGDIFVGCGRTAEGLFEWNPLQ